MDKGYCNQVLFVLNIDNGVNDNASTFAYVTVSKDFYDLWHSRLGHISRSYVKTMQDLNLISRINFKDNNSKESFDSYKKQLPTGS